MSFAGFPSMNEASIGDDSENNPPPTVATGDDDEEDDPEVVKEREREFKKTLEVHYDPNLGAEENEANFQRTMANFCEYLRPEYETALAKEREMQVMKYDEEELAERAWIPGDEFGADGDFRSVAIAYSYQREILTRKIGIPGHPAPALQRWRERKTVEKKAKEWTETQTMTMAEVLAAEYDSVEDEEEAIIKLLAVKYQNIEERKRSLMEAQAGDPDAKRKAQRGVVREGPAPEVGTRHGMWDLMRQEYPRAPLKLPDRVEQGDVIVPNIPGTDTQAWQRNRTIRKKEAINVDMELLEADNDTPAHRFRLGMRKEDIDRCHDFIMATMNGEHFSLKIHSNSSVDKNTSKHKGNISPKRDSKVKKKGGGGGGDKGQRDLTAPGSSATLAKIEAEKMAKKIKKEEREKRKEAKRIKKEKIAMQKLKAEEERKVQKILEEEEAERKRGFLPRILARLGFNKKREGHSSDDDSDEEHSHAVNIADPADWAETYRNQFPELFGDEESALAETALSGAHADDDNFRSRARKRAEMYREQVTDKAAKYVTQDQLVQRASEGDIKGVAEAVLQSDPPLDLNVANDEGMTPLVSAFRTLLQIDASRTDMKGMGSSASKVAGKLNKTLQKDQETVVYILLARGADPEIIDLSDQSPGWTLLHYAAHDGVEDRVGRLLRHGVDVDPVDNNGVTPLMEACRQGHLMSVDALVRCGAKLDRRDKKGWSALHFGAYFGRTAVCKALLLAGATKDMRNRDLKSAAELAMSRNHMRTSQAISTFVKPKIPIKRILAGLEKEAREKEAQYTASIQSESDDEYDD